MENLHNTESNNRGIQNYIIRSIAIILMLAGLYGCYGMLKYVTDAKFERIEAVRGSDITTDFRERQLACLARNIYFEAGNEPFEGKVAVAQVTINRANSGQFPEDLCRVVYQKNVIYERVVCQFSWYCDRVAASRIIHAPVYEESMEVAKKVLLEGFRLPSLTEALYYHADYVNPGWRKQRITKIGRHIFYK
jgi:spore germination cell wall hydrolase CwlJ-like protein